MCRVQRLDQEIPDWPWLELHSISVPESRKGYEEESKWQSFPPPLLSSKIPMNSQGDGFLFLEEKLWGNPWGKAVLELGAVLVAGTLVRCFPWALCAKQVRRASEWPSGTGHPASLLPGTMGRTPHLFFLPA